MATEPTADRPYIIKTWAGRRVFEDETFETFLSARDRIMEEANRLIAAGEMPEDDFDGFCDDLYAERTDGIEDED